jgi:hypothetical protein
MHRFLRAAPLSEGGGLPEDWQIETLDTHRWYNFRWRPIDCISVPPAVSRSVLFAQAMKLLERVAVPYNLLHARYQLPLVCSVVLVEAPLEPMCKILRSQVAQLL